MLKTKFRYPSWKSKNRHGERKLGASRRNAPAPTLGLRYAASSTSTPILNNLAAILRALEVAGVVFRTCGVLLEGGSGGPFAHDAERRSDEQLERARKRNVVTKLKNRRTKLTKAVRSARSRPRAMTETWTGLYANTIFVAVRPAVVV
jgi:hypothetical protein